MKGAGASILVADVGGTKTVLALTSEAGHVLEHVQTLASRDFAQFDHLLRTYLTSIGIVPDAAMIAVADPVLDGRADITNLSWQLDEAVLREKFGFQVVKLINDLKATALAIPQLAETDFIVIQKGIRVCRAPIALIAPGTGLGEAYLTWNGTSYAAHASEGGHTGFAPCDREQDKLLAYLRNQFQHVSLERVCSGSGLANVYRFLIEEDGAVEEPSIQVIMEQTDDITPVIIAAAMSKGSPACEHAVRMLVDCLAAEAANFALKTLALGGVFLGGGIPLRILPFLQSPAFVDRFSFKGRFSQLLRNIPISILRDPLVPLRGAAIHGAQLPANEPSKDRCL